VLPVRRLKIFSSRICANIPRIDILFWHFRQCLHIKNREGCTQTPPKAQQVTTKSQNEGALMLYRLWFGRYRTRV
jgi:hypothetical protein